jgi:hypothetical protein
LYGERFWGMGSIGGGPMKLWSAWYEAVEPLRKACSRQKTFAWLIIVLATFCIRQDHAGVTSLIRAGWLQASCYPLLLNFFHSPAVDVELLTAHWIALVVRTLFTPLKVGGYRILVADGIKIPKEGKKMPSVKCLHNDSENNSKSEFIMGHSFQAISLLADAGHGKIIAVPLMSRISEGVLFTNRDKRTLLDKLVIMCNQVTAGLADDQKTLIVLDAYYASHKVMGPLPKSGVDVITRARNNAVAYRAAPLLEKKCRGRPRLYGDKVQLRSLFEDVNTFSNMPSPVYGETDVTLRYKCIDLIWRPLQRVVRYVLVIHPTRGRMILMSTNMELSPRDIIAVYGLRFKIEVSFKQSVHTLGTYAYHFSNEVNTSFLGQQVHAHGIEMLQRRYCAEDRCISSICTNWVHRSGFAPTPRNHIQESCVAGISQLVAYDETGICSIRDGCRDGAAFMSSIFSPWCE